MEYEYENPKARIFMRVAKWTLSLLVAGTVFYLVFNLFFPNKLEKDKANQQLEEQKRQEQIKKAETMREKLRNCLKSIPALADKKEFYFETKGIHGQNNVIYFNLESFSQKDLSEEDLKQLCEELRTARIVEKANMVKVPDKQLPASFQCHNSLHQFDGTFLAKKKELEDKLLNKSYTQDELFCLSYIYEMEGNYSRKNELDALICQEFGQRCEDNIEVEVTGVVKDGSHQPVQSASVEVLNYPEKGIIAQTDSSGKFTLNFKTQELNKIRLKAWKRNYSDGIVSFYLIKSAGGRYRYENADFVLNSPISIVTINNESRTVTGSGNRVEGDSFIINTSRTNYKIPLDTIVDKSGNAFKGEADVYLYEFDRSTDTSSILTVDTFDEVMGYAGDLMKTYGMPYIQFFSRDGVELYVAKKNPMIITYKIPHMKELRENTDGIFEPVTDEDMEFLVNASKKKEFCIDRAFLIENEILRFPAFWAFDQKRGVWDNVGMSVLDKEGTVKIPWYTIKN